MLKLCDIVKNYETATTTVHALRGVSLSFREHEFVSILGPSGCGKTTLLNIIGGLDRYTGGDLIIGGVSTQSFDDLHWDAYRNATIGFVFQSYNLIPHLSVLENVELALSLVGEKKKVRRAKAIDALRKVGIEGEMNKRPNQLSGGQMQRVAIARAIVNDPKIILADEPTGALDSELSVQVMDILREIADTRLVIMVTHNDELAKTYSTRICKFKDGQLIEDTNPYEYEDAKESLGEDSADASYGAYVGGLRSDNFDSDDEAQGGDADDILTTDTESLDGDVGDVHIVESAQEVDYDSLAIQPDEEKKKVSNRKRKKQMKNLRVDSREIFDRLGLNSLSKKRKKRDSTFKPTSMSAGMAFNLSLRNLISKKRRTFLTAFAGSIGIIGLGLVLAISNGFDVFVNDMQTDSLAGVPVGVYEYNVEASAIMDVMSNLSTTKPNGNAYPSNDKITIKPGSGGSMESGFANLLNAFFKSVSKNDLSEAFAKYMAKMPEDYYDAKSVYYGVRYNLVTKTVGEEGEIEYKDVSQQPEVSTVMTIAMSILGESGVQPQYWQVLVDEDNMRESYTLIGENSRYPQNKNELLLCVGTSNEIDEAMLEEFGISVDGLSADEINSDLFIGKTFKLVDNNNYYRQFENGFFGDPLDSQESFKTMYDGSDTELKIVGVIRPKKRSKAAYVSSSAICYTPELAEYVVNKAYNSEIAKAQRNLIAHPSSDRNSVMASRKWINDNDLASGTSITSVLTNNLAYTSFIKAIGATKAPTYINLYPETYEQKINIGKYVDSWNTWHGGNIGYFDVSEMFIYNLTLIIDLVSILLIAVASISLVVSTVMIGVITSNSVIERTREIGILRALGARKRDVRNVFIAETSLIGLSGGLIGIIVTYILCPIISLIIGAVSGVQDLLHFHPLHAFILVILSLVLTVISGILPAIGASRKNVVDALRVD
ncbi:MAG: ATP-binding cassette domain-containing protein [Bacteroides sp.]|nr:ATP-binding cassette domain-containing protein [Bacillota bacterium]MCM1393474.1 ATP-binding cassette domain-containing protein [[Eubacterium] siraeum]MCM1455292.1 ATP-binding cassette domain-containing protein [Bacteroides sp.]